MSMPRTPWRITGEEVASCNCAWGCPCQFNALPTYGRCEALIGIQVSEGYFGTTRLDGVRFARIFSFPGPIHEGNGTRQLIIDDQATAEQREALVAIESGSHGGALFEIFASVCPNQLPPAYAPITLQSDREGRQARLRVGDLGDIHVEPIKNPVTGAEHRAQIVLPNGFEYKEAEMANAVSLRARSRAPLIFEHENTYTQLHAVDWSNQGS